MNCACGCGTQVRPNSKGVIPKFIRGHYSRTTIARSGYDRARSSPPLEWHPPSGLCECGCGESTPIARATRKERGQYNGYPLRYVNGHNARGVSGAQASGWKGGRWQHKSGYIYVFMPQHHEANQDGYVLEHRLVYEQTHNVHLTKEDHIHHIDGVRDHNTADNLERLTAAEHADRHGFIQVYMQKLSAEDQCEFRSRAGKAGARARWG